MRFLPPLPRLPSMIAACAVLCAAGWAAPANDNFADAQAISSGSFTGSNVSATREAGEPAHAGNPGGASVWWRITPPDSGYLTISTLNSISRNGGDMDTILAVYTGSTLANLVVVGANDDDEETRRLGSRVLIPVTGGTEYYIAVDGFSWEESPADQGQIQLEVSFGLTLPTRPAPPWQLPDINGNMVSSAQYANRVVLLNFWATWCPPCVAEIPDLVALQDKYRDRGLVVVGVSIDDPVNNAIPTSLVGPFSQNLGINYPVVMTRPDGGAMESAYGPLDFIPTSIVVDTHNNIVRRVIGAHTLSDFESYILPHLQDSSVVVQPPATDPIDFGNPAGPVTVISPSEVYLRARRTDGSLILEWPTLDKARIEVQQTDRLPATAWSRATGTLAPGAAVTTFSINERDARAPRYYRLEIVP